MLEFQNGLCCRLGPRNRSSRSCSARSAADLASQGHETVAFGWRDAPDSCLMPPVLSFMKSESVLEDVAVEPAFLPPFPSAESMQNAAN